MKLPLLKKLFLLTVLLVLNLNAFTADDLIIADSLNLNDTIVYVDQNIIVTGEGKLILDHATLYFNLPQDNSEEWSILVEPGGSLEIYNSKILAPDTVRYYMEIDSGDFILMESQIEGLGNGIRLNNVDYAVIDTTNFNYSENGFFLSNSHNCIFSNNRFNNMRVLDMNNSWNNEFVSNIFIRNDRDATDHIISLNSGCGNNIISNNEFLVGDNNTACPPIRFYGVHYPNLVRNNIFDGYKNAILILNSSNIIFADNTMRNLTANFHGGIHIFHSNNLKIYNNTNSNSVASYILFNSDHNEFIGNTIEESRYGIYMFHGSDSNLIQNNNFNSNMQNIILNGSYGNIIQENNFLAYTDPDFPQIFDDGNNSWQGNYYDDYLNMGANELGYYPVPDTLKDSSFVSSPISISPPKTPDYEPVEYDTSIVQNPESIMFSEDTTISSKTFYLESSLCVYNNSKVVFNNCTFIGNRYSCGMHIADNSTLELNNCLLTGKDSYSFINVEARDSTRLIMKDTKLINSAGWGAAVTLKSDSALIDGCEIIGSVTGIRGDETSNHIIKDNLISNCEIGIMAGGENNQFINNIFENCSNEALMLGSTSSIIDSNKFVNTSVGISNSGNNNAFQFNTFHHCNIGVVKHWTNTCFNNLYSNNNFLECRKGLIPYQAYFVQNFPCIIQASGDYWDNDLEGNYWFDYLDKYPNAKPSLTNDNVWDIPYQLESYGEELVLYDNFPLRNPHYTDTTILEPSIPILNMPINESKVESNITFDWFGCDNAKSYRLQLANDSSFLSPVVNVGNLTDTSYFFAEPIEGIYYWRVLASNMGIMSDWSEIFSFTYNSVIVNYNTESSLSEQINIYPNPTKQIININNINSCALISIYSIEGQKLFMMEITSNHSQIEVSDLDNGIYIICISTKDLTYFAKFIKE